MQIYKNIFSGGSLLPGHTVQVVWIHRILSIKIRKQL